MGKDLFGDTYDWVDNIKKRRKGRKKHFPFFKEGYDF